MYISLRTDSLVIVSCIAVVFAFSLHISVSEKASVEQTSTLHKLCE